MSDLRKIEVFRDNKWQEVQFYELRVGDILRRFEPTGEEVFDNKGKTIFQATSNPLGLIPRQAHDYQRIQDIKEAMIRYITAHMDIPTEWLEEWGELMRKYPNADFQLFEVKDER